MRHDGFQLVAAPRTKIFFRFSPLPHRPDAKLRRIRRATIESSHYSGARPCRDRLILPSALCRRRPCLGSLRVRISTENAETSVPLPSYGNASGRLWLPTHYQYRKCGFRRATPARRLGLSHPQAAPGRPRHPSLPVTTVTASPKRRPPLAVMKATEQRCFPHTLTLHLRVPSAVSKDRLTALPLSCLLQSFCPPRGWQDTAALCTIAPKPSQAGGPLHTGRYELWIGLRMA